MQQNMKLHSDDGSKEVDGTMYRKQVGSLIYLTTTRPYIAYFVSVLSQFMAGPLEINWREVTYLIRHLKGTIDFGLKYTNSFDVELTGYSDSDYTGNLNDRKSTVGYPYSIESGIVSWSSKKHPTVSFPSTKAEYKALCSTNCEVVWLRRVLQNLGEEQKRATMIKCDN